MSKPRSRQQLRAVLRLREMILAGAFKPGERVSELAAVEALGISRTPVRLALSALEHEGLLERLSSGGFVVRDFSIADIADAIEMRGVLEGTAGRFAAERHDGPGDLKVLRGIAEQLDELLEHSGHDYETFEHYVELNEQFHAELLRLARCPLLERTLAQVTALPFASANAFVLVQAERPRSRDILYHAQYQHLALIEAIIGREGARAEAIGREHARLARRNLHEVMAEDHLFVQVPGSVLIRRDKKSRAGMATQAEAGSSAASA